MPWLIRTAIPIFAALMLIGAASGWAEEPDSDNALNGPPTPDAVQTILARDLPPGWQISTPTMELGMWEAKISIPSRWQGNPEAVAVNHCPSPDNPVWQSIPSLNLIVRYRNRDWPAYRCEP